MRAKHLSLSLAIVALLIAGGGFWFGRSAWRADSFHKSSVGVGSKTPRAPNFDPTSAAASPKASQPDLAPRTNNRPRPGQVLRPPDPTRRFTDFTPEQRVEFARKGHGPGG